MNNIREYWDEVRLVREELAHDGHVGSQGEVYLASQNSRKKGTMGGRITVATVHVAALMISQDTHRVAKPEEVATWKKDQHEQGKFLTAEAAKKDAKVNINMGDLFNQMLENRTAPSPEI